MALVIGWLRVVLIIALSGVLTDSKFANHISTAQRIQSHGYPAESHYVTTKDGFILGMFRIPYSHKLQNAQSQRPAVLLFHGLFSSSDAFILTGPDDGLAYNLADAGYDVWLGNARGNFYSRNSTLYSVDHPYFWSFNLDDIANFDIGAMIDHVLLSSGEKALHYVGHSQGTTTFIAALSANPDYNVKIKTAHLMAPVAYMAHVKDPMLTTLAKYLGQEGVYSSVFGAQEFLPHNSFFMALGYKMCGENSPDFSLCSSAAVILEGYAPNANKTIFPILAETHPAGASTNQILHYMQFIQSGLFQSYDYGAKKNMQAYGQNLPPTYDIRNVTALVSLYYGDNDNMAVKGDVLKLAAELQNLKLLHHVDNPTWAHADFTWATSAKHEINRPIMEGMNAFEKQFH